MKMLFKLVVAIGIAVGLLASGAMAQSVSKRFRNWTYDCTQGVCQIYITLADKVNNKNFAFTVLHDAKTKTYSGILKMPLGVALPPGVRVFTNMRDNYAFTYQFCDTEGCNAIAKLDPKLVQQMHDVSDVQVEYFAYGKQKLDAFRISMEGFTAAAEALLTEVK